MLEIYNQILFLLIFILLMLILISVLILKAKTEWRFPRLMAFESLPARKGLREKIDGDTLDEIIGNAGYAYDPVQDLFYSTFSAWQKDMGYCRLYDEGAILSGMIIDCEPIYFEYDGKKWLIEFWKGQYGMCTGGEVGVYNTEDFDLHISDLFTGTFYLVASYEDLLLMSFTLIKDGKELFTRKSKHWWLTGFKLGEFSETNQLMMDIQIKLKDSTMRNAFIGGLIEAGYSEQEIDVYDNTVSLRFDKPRTLQPISRTPLIEWPTQRKNEMLCYEYQEITRPYDNQLDKINAILEESPELFSKFIKIGRDEKSFN